MEKRERQAGVGVDGERERGRGEGRGEEQRKEGRKEGEREREMEKEICSRLQSWRKKPHHVVES